MTTADVFVLSEVKSVFNGIRNDACNINKKHIETSIIKKCDSCLHYSEIVCEIDQ